MTKALFIIVALCLCVVIYFIILGKTSRSSEPVTLSDGKLPPCPNKPNCVCSEYQDDANHYIPPIPIEHISSSDAIQIFEIIILETGGEIKTVDDSNLSATFSSALFGFVDDVQIRIDSEQKLIHFRSASRVGHSDMGVNLKRIDEIKTSYEKMNNTRD